MIEFQSVFGMQFFFLCLMVVGFITVKTRMVDAHARAAMTDLILCVFLPATILYSFFGSERSLLPSLGIILVISLGVLILSFALSLVLYKRVSPDKKKVLLYATLISNASLLGNPIVESLYGTEGVTYVAAYLLPIRVAVWTVGLMIFSGNEKGKLKKVIFHPCFIATYLGLLVMAAEFTPPYIVSRLAFTLGSCTTPFSMIVVGGILATVDFKKIITRLTVYFTFIRLILIPLLVMGILLIFRPDPMISAISVILCGMPAGVTTSILADKYGGDSDLASRIVFVSTLLSIVTIPLLFLLLQRVF